MSREALSIEAAERVTPRALLGYARGLGWQSVPSGKRIDVAVYHRPDSRLHQVIIPTDPTLLDYGEAVTEAVRKLADFEKRPATEVLEHLILPPADLLRLRVISPDSENGNLPFDHAVRMINGTRRLLLSVAHSVLVPQAYHPRLSRSEAEEFVSRCRLGQTERGSFILNVACPLEIHLSLPGLVEIPFARRVTTLLMQSLEVLQRSADTPHTDELLDPTRNPGLSANFCESLLLLRPSGDRATLTVWADWSRAMLPESRESSRQVQLSQIVFDVAEAIAPRLRTTPTPKPSRWFGFVDALRGQPSPDEPRPSGEVDFTLFDDQEGEVRARGILNAEEYATAAAAHLASDLVAFRATLRRLPRTSRVDGIADFVRWRV